jgi:hypothetical protein
MNLHCSLAQAVESSEGSSSGGEPSVPSRSTSIASGFLCSGRMTESLSRFRSGRTSEHSTGNPGLDAWISSQAGSRARRLVRRVRATSLLRIYGRKCSESLQRSLPGLCLRKTSAEALSMSPQEILSREVIKPECYPLARRTWVLTTFGPDIGYLHTPTTKANYASPTMQKWPSCRNFVRAFGRPSPWNQEWLMGIPIGWTDSKQLETCRFQRWLEQHGEY